MPSFFFHLTIDLVRSCSWEHPPTPRNEYQGAFVGSVRDQNELPRTVQTPSNSCSEDADLSSAFAATTSHDWRYDKIIVQNFRMTPVTPDNKPETTPVGHITNGISTGPTGSATKGRFEPLDPQHEELGWGVVRLWRDSEETPGLYDAPESQKPHKNGRQVLKKSQEGEVPFRDGDCTTLCILAVPSYLTPSDFLGFVGEKTRDDVSHFRMVRTERGNRYMVLMKFRNGKKAREWRREWNGKFFDSMEPENCHVVFVKSIEFRTNGSEGSEASFPDMTNDPFTPSNTKAKPPASTNSTLQSTSIPSNPRSSKPHAPRTPSLIELPTCPVCLERMDESTGLLTVLCQHVFHCSCIHKWRGSACPVCRYTQDDVGLGKRGYIGTSNGAHEHLNECSVCHSDANLWICLICGNVGCGRYDAAHAFSHFEQSQHCFAMDMETQRVWDYASDGYVHRIVQNKSDGKFVEITPTSTPQSTQPQSYGDDDFDDYVPREKLDNIGLEYTHLLTSQLASQRMYFEEILERAADKASQAAASAETATASSSQTASQLAALQTSHDIVANETVPQLERDRDRAVRKAEKFETMARKLEREWRDEKAMNESLMARIKTAETKVGGLTQEKAELEEQNRDLGFFISGMEKLKTSGLEEEDVREGTVSLPDRGVEEEGGGKGKGKGKKKGGGKK